MQLTRVPQPPATSEERAHLTFWTLGVLNGDGRRGRRAERMLPTVVPISQRVRRLPEALLLTAGYYASRTPVVGELLRRR